jgi:signal transduction histidine kinase
MQDSTSILRTRHLGGQLRLTVSIYRALALTLAVSQMSSSGFTAPVSAMAIAIAAASYTFLKFFIPVSLRSNILGQMLLAFDLIFCAVLVWLTGGINSPFLLFTLAPVLTASLYFGPYMSATVGVASALDVLLAQLANPFSSLTIGPTEISYFLIYLVAVCLSAVLPYLVNVNLHQRLQSEFVTEERQRLSREIHDGTVQTLTAINWRGQLIERELSRRGIALPEVDKLLRLVEDARVEALESLELLRKYSGAGQMISQLKNYLHHLKQDAGIDYSINLPAEEPSLPSHIELQILRICQEAMNNIRKHAEAHNIFFEMNRKDGHISVVIEDDGKGFDVGTYYHGRATRGHGLNVMKERAASAGGSLLVTSVPGKGTTIRIDIPLDRR